MDNTLKNLVAQVMTKYAGEALNGQSYLLQDDENSRFSVLDVGTFNGQRVTGISLIVLLEGNRVIIERDQNDYPLVDELVASGVSREQIILAYKGEPVPEATG
jgi:hypothetical protein